MSNGSMMFGAGGAVIGLLVGLLLGGGSDDLEQSIKETLGSQSEASAKLIEDKIAALDERLSGIEAAVAAGTDAQAGMGTAVKDQIDGAVETLSGKVDGMAASVTEGVTQAVAEAGAAQSASLQDAMSSELAGLSEKVDGAVTAATAAAAAATSAATLAPAAPAAVSEGAAGTAAAAATPAAATAAATAPVEEPAEEIDGTTIGMTQYFVDGKIRVFVSGIIEDGAAARVAVNGQDTAILRPRRPITFELDEVPCQVALDAIVKGHVQMTGSCEE